MSQAFLITLIWVLEGWKRMIIQPTTAGLQVPNFPTDQKAFVTGLTARNG